MGWVLKQGDCLKVMRESIFLKSDLMGAMVTDPPAGIDFMKQILKWDSSRGGRDAWVDWLGARMNRALDVCKPGAFGAVWSHQRTTHWTGLALENAGWEIHGQVYHLYGQGMGRNDDLKPAVEPWYLVRKPLSKGLSEKANVERWGVGRLNIDFGRVPRDAGDVPGWHKSGAKGSTGYRGTSTFRIRDMSAEEIQERCGTKDRYPPNLWLGEGGDVCLEDQRRGVSRFFPQAKYVPKPTRAEREKGCEGLPDRTLNRLNPGGLAAKEDRFKPITVKNHHTTVKPVEFMRWLIGMFFHGPDVNQWVFDPFCGSGTTGVAALQLGYSFLGIEEDAEHYQTAQARIEREALELMGQETLFDEDDL